MFRDYIINPIDPIPVEYVATLKRLEFEKDYSLTCLGIAMLKSRMENYSGISGKYSSYDKLSSSLLDFERNIQSKCEEPSLFYYIYSISEEDKDFIKEKFEPYGFEIKDSIGLLLKQKCEVECTAVYHKEKNIAAIFIRSQDIRYYHMLIGFISVLFPSLFKNSPLKPEEYELIKSMNRQDKTSFIQAIQNCVKPYAFEFKHLMLATLLRNMHETRINNAKREVDNQRESVKMYERQYTDAIASLKEMIRNYEGMKATEQMDKPEEELVDYLATNPHIHNMLIRNGKLSFSVSTLLNNYNENAWKTFSDRGGIYDGKYRTILLDVFTNEKNRRIFLDQIFSDDPEFTVKIAGNYTLDLQSCHIATRSDYNYETADPMYKSYLPNPHLKLFSCLGGYERRVIEQLYNRNYIGAIELCIASAGSVDLDETDQTFRPFLGWIMSSREKILRRKDGVEMTPEEALIYLIDKEKENETDQTDN